MEARSPDAQGAEDRADDPRGRAPDSPARWAKPFVLIDAAWTKIETYLVLILLLLAILYMGGWVSLNAFHTKGGKLAKYPGSIALFASFASLAAWGMKKEGRKLTGLIVPIVLGVLGAILLKVSGKLTYFANVSSWLTDGSTLRLIGTPAIVSSRLFTIWVALLGASLATGAGRQINVDIVMRFIGPRPRLAVALFGYVVAAFACMMISWGFIDYLAITRFADKKEAVQLRAEEVKLEHEADRIAWTRSCARAGYDVPPTDPNAPPPEADDPKVVGLCRRKVAFDLPKNADGQVEPMAALVRDTLGPVLAAQIAPTDLDRLISVAKTAGWRGHVAKMKVPTIGRALKRHSFIIRKQFKLDVQGFSHVVLKGEKFDSWYQGADWNKELNEGGWKDIYPAPPLAPDAIDPSVQPPPKVAQNPCLSDQEREQASNGQLIVNGDWKLVSSCHDPSAGAARAPVVQLPEPDDRYPLESDLSLLFPWGFFVIGCRFLLRGVLAIGGAVSTDPNAAHGSEEVGTPHGPESMREVRAEPVGDALVAIHPPIVETKVEEEARAHEGERTLPSDTIGAGDARKAAKAKVEAKFEDLVDEAKGAGGEAPHHHVDDVKDPNLSEAERRHSTGLAAAEPVPESKKSTPPPAAGTPATEAPKPEASPNERPTAPPPPKMPSVPPEGLPTAQRLEAAAAAAREEEEERTLVGDLSELAKAQELLAAQEEARAKKKAADAEKAKKSGPGGKGGAQ
jgi:hypothetical protein